MPTRNLGRTGHLVGIFSLGGQASIEKPKSTKAANGFVILSDPKALFAAQNVVPLITKSKVTPTISAALDAVSAKLDTATLGELVKEVVIDKKDPAVVAKEFLTKNGLG